MSKPRRLQGESAPSDQELAIGATVLYSSLFEYPLSEDEVRQNLLFFSTNGDSISATYSRSPWLQKRVSVQSGFYVPVGHEDWIQLRESRREASLELIRSHLRLLKLICSLPFTRLVALSGSVSHLNIGPRGDLDLIIITEGSQVWSVAVAAILLARAFRRRRTICVNFLLGGARLEIRGQDLFSASQMIHLRPLADSGLLPRFLGANPFIWEYFPEFQRRETEPLVRPGGFARMVKRCLEGILALGPGQLLEWACRLAYSGYLLRQAPSWKTADQVELDQDCLKLHSQSHRLRVLSTFEQLLIQEIGEPECWRIITRMRTPVRRSPPEPS